MENRSEKDLYQKILLILFATIASVSIIIRLGWKHLHKLIPRLPFKPKWPNFVIGFFQLLLYIILICVVLFWYYIEVNVNAADYQKTGDFVTDMEAQHKSVQTNLSSIQYPTHGQALREFFPKEIFQIRSRFRAMEKYSIGGLDEFEKWMNDTSCKATKEKNDRRLQSLAENVGSIREDPLSISKIRNAMEQWKSVKEQWKNDPYYVGMMTSEKNTFDSHLKRTKIMFATVRKIWKKATEDFKIGIVAVTRSKNKEVIVMYGASAFVAITFAFWSVFNTILFSQYHLPRLWLQIMRTLFFICAAQTIILSVYKHNAINEFRCTKYSGPFRLFDFNIPSYQTNSDFDTKSIFSSCISNEKSIFSNSKIDTNDKMNAFIKTLELKLRGEASKLLAYAKTYDPVVENRKNELAKIVEELAKIRLTCPEVEHVLSSFDLSKNILLEYLEYKIDVHGNAFHAVDVPMGLLEKMLQDPVLEFNEIINNADINCRDMYNTYVHGYNLSCKAVNSVVVEHLEMMVIGCSSFLALFHLFYLRRADYTQFWDDCRVRWAQKIFNKKYDEEQYKEWEQLNVHDHDDATYKNFFKKKNKMKNRYLDIPLRDQTRVVLRDYATDYIHASWIPVPETNRTYICTQGPMSNTFADFWHMIVQENVKIIVMTTGFIEMDIRICGYYFPSNPGQTETYGHVKVTCVASVDLTWEKNSIWHTTTRTFHLIDTNNPHSDPITVKHVFIWHWFDQTIPKNINRIVFSHRYIDELRTDDSPVVVHCDSGIGRSALFIAVDVLKVKVDRNEYVSMVEIARYVSSHRVGSLERYLDFLVCLVSVLHGYVQDLILYDEDVAWSMKLYQDVVNNKNSLQDNIRCEKQTSVHYWRHFEDPAWFDTCEIKRQTKKEESERFRKKKGKRDKKRNGKK